MRIKTTTVIFFLFTLVIRLSADDMKDKYDKFISYIKSSFFFTYESAKEIVNQGLDVNITNEYGKTPLHIVAGHTNVSIAALLIKKGANLDAKDNEGNTPLHLAVQNTNSLKGVDLLIKSGANINSTNNLNKTPLMLAVRRNDSQDMRIFKLLLKNNADAEVLDKENFTVYHYSMKYYNYFRTLILYRKNGYEKRKNDLLFECVKSGKYIELKVLEYMINDGINIDEQDIDGKTLLMYAVSDTTQERYFYRQIVNLLIEKGKNLNIRDNEGYTAFHYFIKYNRSLSIYFVLKNFEYNQVQLFIKNGADINALTNEGHSVLDILELNYNKKYSKSEYKKIRKGLKSLGAQYSSFNPPPNYALLIVIFSILLIGSVFIIIYFLRKIATTISFENSENSFHKLILMIIIFAIKNGFSPIVRLLINTGIDVNHEFIISKFEKYQEHISDPYSPTGTKTIKRKFESYRCIKNFLILAIEHQKINIVKYLLKKGSDPNYKVIERETYRNTYRFHGEDEFSDDKKTTSAIEFAQKTKNNKLISLLQKHGAVVN